MTRLTEEVSTYTQMGQDMKDNGLRILSMASVKKHGLMVHLTKATTDKDRNMERDNFLGQTIVSTLATSRTTISREQVSMNGVMAVYIMDNGLTIKCMDMVYSSGLMVVFTRESMLKT